MIMTEKSPRQNTLPRLDIKTGHNHSPHVVILGAGASRACCPNGDNNGKKLPLMNDFIDTIGLRKLIETTGENPNNNFEVIYSNLFKKNEKRTLQKIADQTYAYFKALELPEQVTLYDYLILSLRKKDLIITFNWDPLLPQAYQRWRQLGDVLPQMVFLHGNVDIGVDRDKKLSGFLSDEPWPGRRLAPTPLLYPIEQKDYSSDVFVAHQWQVATDYLEEAYYITVYGYSAPATDVEARLLLLNAWQKNTTRTLAEIDIIDIRKKEDVRHSWSDFLEGVHGGVSNTFEYNILLNHPRRSCEAFAFASLQQAPWYENSFPPNPKLHELKAWVSHLIEEEKTGKLSDVRRSSR